MTGEKKGFRGEKQRSLDKPNKHMSPVEFTIAPSINQLPLLRRLIANPGKSRPALGRVDATGLQLSATIKAGLPLRPSYFNELPNL
jgi:hypothetical protein